VNSQYRRVSRHRTCLICGKPDWCSYTPDAKVSFCARITTNADRVSRTGWGVFYHEKSLFVESTPPFPAKPPPKKTELAPIEIRDFVYRKLIALSSATRFPEIIDGPKGLRSRKILNFEDFGSLPPTHCERRDLARLIRKSINREFPDYVRKSKSSLVGIPGFWIDEKGQAQLWLEKDYSCPLMVIPYRNSDGRIQACQIRFMKKNCGDDLRYIWLSTPKKKGSASCGCPIHFVRPLSKSTLTPKPILVTEGALKAETVQPFYPQFSVVAIGGISSSHSELIKASRFSPLIVGFDNDFSDNLQVLRQFLRFLSARFSDAKKYCYDPDMKILSWSSKFKGIDEALIHNQAITQITFSQWLTLLNGSLSDELCYSFN
jgi:hypothetical protein